MIKVDRYSLNIALDALVKFVAKKSILPILANIYVGLDDDQLVLMATQLDDYTRINVPLVHVEPMPEFTVSAKEFLLVVKAIKKPHVTIEPHIHTLESGASIVTGVAVDEWTLSTIDTSEWPPVWQMITVSNALSFNGENLAWMVKSAARSANVDSARPALTALNMRISGEENTMNMVAADGFRLMIIGE